MSVTQAYKNSQSEIIQFEHEIADLRTGIAILAAFCAVAVPCILLLLITAPA